MVLPLILFLLLPLSAQAAALTCAEAVDGATLRLDDGGLLRLEGILPDRAAAAQSRLQALCRQFPRLDATAPWTDRRRRQVAQVTAGDVWLQGVLLAEGLARVATEPDGHARADEMLALEAAARAAGRGLWADPASRVLTPEDTPAAIGRFVIVEGSVRRVLARRDATYLDFGADWRSDFSVVVRAGNRRDFKPLELEALQGRVIRVRGWLGRGAGPLLEADHRQQIELAPR